MSATSTEKDNKLLLLGAGVVVVALSGGRFNVPSLGWVALTPWLLYLRRMRSGYDVRAAAAFMGAVQLGVLLNVAEIVTDPIPWFYAPFLSVPPALGLGVAPLTYEALRRCEIGDGWWGTLMLFPSLVVSLEFVSGWKGSSWGSLAYTQMDDLALLQVVSLFGLGGLSFLLASSSAVAALLLDRLDRRTEKGSERARARFRPVTAAATVAIAVVAAQLWGSWRLDRSLAPGPMVTVAAVGSDMALPIINWPSRTEIRRADDVLFERTRRAARAGAEVVVWNEGATAALTSADEAALLKRGEVLARKHGIDIVMGYTLPLDDEVRSYENKYSWMGPEGVVDTYNKHHPVPGLEKCVPGAEPVRVLNRTWGRAAGAICYDYDFPGLAMAHARGGAGVVMVPASDWRGIDGFHTRMASVRGIEGGFSVVRSVRDAASGAYDALGRTLATLSWYDEGDCDGRRVMLARVPVTPLPTLYSRIGDVLPWSCLGLVIATIGVAATRVCRRGGLVKRKVKAV